MTKWARINTDGTIDAIYHDQPEDTAGFVEIGDQVVADWRFVDGGFVPPSPAPEPVPEVISDRQFAMEARDRGYISQAEALAFVSTGSLPAVIMEIISALPTEQARDDAAIVIAGATIFERHHALSYVLANAMRGEQEIEAFMDSFFRSAYMR